MTKSACLRVNGSFHAVSMVFFGAMDTLKKRFFTGLYQGDMFSTEAHILITKIGYSCLLSYLRDVISLFIRG